MSRGPGHVTRAVMETLDANPDFLATNSRRSSSVPGYTDSDRASMARAIRSLAKQKLWYTWWDSVG